MTELVLDTPEWAEPLLQPARYRGAHGGRGCCHPDTLIDTPQGQVKIREFKGGPIFSHDGEKIVIATATPAISYTEEQLYLVTLADGRSISVTDEHRFLTQRGWVYCRDLQISDELVCANDQARPCPHPTTPEHGLSAFPEGGRSSTRKRADCPGDYSTGRRQCDRQLPLAEDSGQASSPSQGDEPPHTHHALMRGGGLACASTNSPSRFSRPQPSLDALPEAEGQGSEASGIDNAGKISEPLSASSRSLGQSHTNTGLQMQGEGSFAPQQDRGILKNPVGSLQTGRGTRPHGVDGGSRFAPSCNHDLPILVGVKSICKHDRLVYWDLHVPVLENYLSNGIVNHNSGKSHLFAENAVEEMIYDPHASIVCIREYQKSLKFSVKRLIESKIKAMGAGSCFDIQRDEIRRRRGSGVMIFQGMQDHTADSIKSLDGFKIAWIEEAQNLSDRSLTLLRPTIRAPNSEIWASWNPDQPTDAIDKLLRGETPPPDSVVVEVNYFDNPFLPDVLREEMEYDRQHSPDSFDHVWNGAYNKKVKAQIFGGKWRVEAFTPGDDWDGPYHGLDWGFSSDPTAAVRLWIHAGRLYVEYDASKRGLELDDTVQYLSQEIPGIERYRIIADNARPESISHCRRHGFPAIEGAVKGKGSVEDGIEFIRNFKEVVIHERCQETQREFRLYSYKVDKLSGDVLPEIVDAFNHCIDAIRYGLEPVAANNDDFKRFLALS